MDLCQCGNAQHGVVREKGVEDCDTRHDGRGYDAGRAHLLLPSEDSDLDPWLGSTCRIARRMGRHQSPTYRVSWTALAMHAILYRPALMVGFDTNGEILGGVHVLLPTTSVFGRASISSQCDAYHIVSCYRDTDAEGLHRSAVRFAHHVDVASVSLWHLGGHSCGIVPISEPQTYPSDGVSAHHRTYSGQSK